jgi:tetratricopeptide (TPR) repeat protein
VSALSDRLNPRLGELAARYNLARSEDWQRLERLLDFNEGFAFVLLMAPNEDGASICRMELERRLGRENRTLLDMSPANENELRQLAGRLLSLQPQPETGLVWVSAAVSEDHPDHPKWSAAWFESVARLNQYRNPMMRQIGVPLIFAGAPWLQRIVREGAPDLWSVRAMVARVEPAAGPLAPRVVAGAGQVGAVARTGPDPRLALKEAEGLRGVPGRELVLARLLQRAGIGFNARYQWKDAIGVLREALELRVRAGAPAADLADSRFQLAQALWRTLDYESAVGVFNQARGEYQQASQRLGEANCIQRLGDIALARSDHEGARRRYEEALPLYKNVGDVLGEANCIKSLGDIALRRSDHEGARRRYEEALPLYKNVGDVLGEANCIRSLGDIALARSDHEGARRRYEEALPLYKNVGDVQGEANCIRSLGNIAFERSDHEGARRRYEEALPLYKNVGDVLGEANCIRRLGDIALARSDHEGARRRYEEALPLYRQVGSVLGEANWIQSLGDIALARSDHEGARRRYEEALPLYRQVGSVQGEANCILSLGDIALREGHEADARKRFEDALALYRRIAEPYSIGWTLRRLARMEEDEGKRAALLQEIVAAWRGIDREDLVEGLRGELPGEF